MKTLLKYSVLAISIGLASACSGGGGGGDNKDTANPAYDKKEVNANTNIPSSSYVREDLKAEVRSAKELTIFDPETKEAVKIIQLSDYPKGNIKETFSSKNALTTYMRLINLPYSSAATFHTNETKEIAENSFFGGYPTKLENLPRGNATYQGTSLGLNTAGLLTLTANFDNKTVQGRIYNRRHNNGTLLSDITLERGSITSRLYNSGKEYISAATFSGTATTDTYHDYYHGMFAGPNAEEVSGLVTDSYRSDAYEAFAGEKQ